MRRLLSVKYSSSQPARGCVIIPSGAKYTRVPEGAKMYDIAYILALFESLPAHDQHEILELAAQLAAESQRSDP